MKAIIDLRQYQSKSQLLGALVERVGLNPARVTDLDDLYEAMTADPAGSEDLQIIFTHKSQLPKALSVYFGMLTMTIEEVAEKRPELSTRTYYEEEDKHADGTGQKDL